MVLHKLSKNLVEGAACEADALYKATDIYNVIKSVPTADGVIMKLLTLMIIAVTES